MYIMNFSELNSQYYEPILRNLLGHLPKGKNAKNVEELLEVLKEEAEKSTKEDIRASILPTSVSKKEGKNFYLPEEKLLLEQEVKELIDDLSGVFLKSGQNIFILKIKNSKLFDEFRKEIIKEGFSSGVNIGDLFKNVGIELKTREKIYIEDYSNVALFLLLNYFILYALKKITGEKVNIDATKILEEILREIEKERLSYIEGVFTVLTKQKKRKYYLTNLSRFIQEFYRIEIEEQKYDKSILGSFIFSFYTNDKDFRDKLLGLLDKFLYYLIFKLKVNFDILCKMLDQFYSLKRKLEKLKLKEAQKFYIMMNLEKVYNWAYSIGKQIQELDPEDGKDYIDEIIKEIKKEELPGRFFDELAKVLHKVSEKLKKKVGKDVKLYIHPDIVRKELYGDEFYKVKAAILSGLINSI